MTRALLVYPEFLETSFWNYRETCRIMDARYPAAPLGMCTVAALLPPEWDVRLVDCNVETLEDAALEWADVVLTGGMIAQQRDCQRVIRRARALGRRVVVGGPDATSSPHLYAEADHLVLGEGEVTLPAFLADLAKGVPKARYEDARRADIRASPVPRFDLLKLDRYLHVGVQWCRGCPFTCEFCDVIELFGRVPRTKSNEQLLRELEALYRLGYRGHVDLVDDNFIGNKKEVKRILAALEPWLDEHGWPFEFTTEASINLADDPELLRLMQRAGFFAVFVGLESPDDATLVASGKLQNARRSLARDVRKIYEHGMFVNSGFILGMDGERGSVARSVDRVHRGDGDPGEHGGPARGPARHPSHPPAGRGGPPASQLRRPARGHRRPVHGRAQLRDPAAAPRHPPRLPRDRRDDLRAPRLLRPGPPGGAASSTRRGAASGPGRARSGASCAPSRGSSSA